MNEHAPGAELVSTELVDGPVIVELVEHVEAMESAPSRAAAMIQEAAAAVVEPTYPITIDAYLDQADFDNDLAGVVALPLELSA